MKFLRNKLLTVLIIFISVLSLIAGGIAVNLTVTLSTKKRQFEKPVLTEEQKDVMAADAFINPNKLSEQALFFNGVKLSGIKAFTAEKKDIFIPLDDILNKLGANFEYFSTDDFVETQINGKKLLIKIGKRNFNYGGKEFDLVSAPVTAKDHILVPAELLEKLEGFKVSGFAEKGSVFVNYHPDYNNILNREIKLLKLTNSIGHITDISGRKDLWNRKNPSGGERFEFSYDGSRSILKSAENIYVLNSGSGKEPYPVDIDPGAALSADGRYLYWVDKYKKTSFLYDIAGKSIKTLGNYYFRIQNNDEYGYLLYGGDILRDYVEIDSFKRVVLTNRLYDAPYTFIERGGKTVVEGNCVYSPDKTKVLFRKGLGYYIANSDGTGITYLENGGIPVWVNNKRIQMSINGERYLLDKQGRNRVKTESDWKMVGQTPEGDIFFTRDNDLYIESQLVEKKLAELPGTCDYVYAINSDGPYIAVLAGVNDSVLFIGDGSIMRIGSSSQLLKRVSEGEVYTDYKGSLTISPQGGNAVLFQWVDGMLTFNKVSTSSNAQYRIVLDLYLKNAASAVELVKTKWISEDSLLIYTPRRGWVADFKDGVNIYEWAEPRGSSIQGVMP